MEQFTFEKINVHGIVINTARSGYGELPVVLLHGFPESLLCWRRVAPELAKQTAVVCMDLRGYGDSDKPHDSTDPNLYSKKTMAKDVHEVMRHLGYSKYIVVGHDRGATVAFRVALDYPAEVAGLVVLDVLPTTDTWRVLQGTFGVFSYHMFLLAQPADYPERLIGANPDVFFNHTMDTWCKTPDAIPAGIRNTYLQHFRDPATLHAMCEDYRAGAFIDANDDKVANEQGKKIQSPVRVLWQKPEGFTLPFDPIAVWQAWATKKVEGAALACGHFLPEEKPAEVISCIKELLGASLLAK